MKKFLFITDALSLSFNLDELMVSIYLKININLKDNKENEL